MIKISTFLPLISLIVKFFLYILAGKIRGIQIPLMTCAVISGASILAGEFPLPELIRFAVVIGFSTVYIVRNTNAEVLPDGIGIPLAVEIVAAFALSFVVVPAIELFTN